APDGDGPRLDGGVGLDDEDVRALLPGLDRFGRNHEGARIVGQRENDIDEAAGPEGARGVREGRLETDRAGCPVDRVVDERKLSRLRLVATAASGLRTRRCRLGRAAGGLS